MLWRVVAAFLKNTAFVIAADDGMIKHAVRKHFEALGIRARNIITLEGQAATGNKIKSYLEEWLPLNVKEASTLFIYYSGHGAPDPISGQAYLVPWDGDPRRDPVPAIGLDYSVSALGYFYPGGRDVNYFELQTTIAKTLGPVTTTLTLAD